MPDLGHPHHPCFSNIRWPKKCCMNPLHIKCYKLRVMPFMRCMLQVICYIICVICHTFHVYRYEYRPPAQCPEQWCVPCVGMNTDLQHSAQNTWSLFLEVMCSVCRYEYRLAAQCTEHMEPVSSSDVSRDSDSFQSWSTTCQVSTWSQTNHHHVNHLLRRHAHRSSYRYMTSCS